MGKSVLTRLSRSLRSSQETARWTRSRLLADEMNYYRARTNAVLRAVQLDKVELENGSEAMRKVVCHPGGVSAAILTDKLNIGREAAYRRLRGEVPFTFGEAGVLSAQMNFSLDRAVGAVDFGNVLFRLSFNDYHTALEDYTGVIDQDTLFYREVSSDADAEQAIAGNSFPRMLYMRYEGLTNFKLFKWLYQQGLVDCSTTKFEDMKVPDALLRSYRDLLKEAQLMPATTLVFDGSCTKRWVNAICAFRNMHLITDQSVEMLKGELLQLLDELEEIAVAGQFRSGKPVSIYISDMDIEATYCYVAARHYRASCCLLYTSDAADEL